MLFFSAPAEPEPAGLILTAAEAARQRARRRIARRIAADGAARLLALAGRGRQAAR